MSTVSFTDSYIQKAAPFAQPILTHLRQLVHRACPEIIESRKWGMPCFEYKGILCSMAAFKYHCVFGFWKAALMKDHVLLENAQREDSMGHLGRITSLQDLPPDQQIIDWVLEAMVLNEKGTKLPKKPKASLPKTMVFPDILIKALKQNPLAQKQFATFSASAQREYIEWIIEAKTEATQQKRLHQTIEWVQEGKKRNWKYEKR